MPAQHTIDTERRLLVTTWTGEAGDGELIDALNSYQQDIRSRFHSYDEVVDFSQVDHFTLSSHGIRRLAQLATNDDAQGARTKLAIIVDSDFAFGLGRMYEAYRDLVSNSSKEVRVFRCHRDALGWIGS